MIQAKTYTVGDGTVRRLDDLTPLWVDVSVSNTFPLAGGNVFFDVETDPLNGAKVFVVGEGRPSIGNFGIYLSVNEGNSWLIPGGNYQTNYIIAVDRIAWFEVWVLDSNNIMVAGERGYVAISTDGGATFNLSTQLPPLPACAVCSPAIPTCLSVHFPTAISGVVGTDAHVALTIDGGVTWSIMNGGNILSDGFTDAFQVRGIHMDATQQIIVALAKNAIFRSIDGGLTWSVVYNWTTQNGEHLTWINDLELWGFGSNGERIKTLDGGATWIVIQAWSPLGPVQNAGHFYLGQNGFWSQGADILATANGSTTGVVSEIAPTFLNAVWTWYQDKTCYQLISCDGLTAPILVDNDLSAYVGQVIQVCPGDLPDPGGSGTGTGVPIIPDPLIPCSGLFRLIDCCGLRPTVTISNNLSAYLNGVVVIPFLSFTTCWRVEVEIDDVINLGCIDLSGGTYYNDCIACLSDHPCTPTPILTECKCFTIEEAPGCDGAITLLNIGPIFDTCQDCDPKCFMLVDCLDVNNYILSNDLNLEQYLGLIVTLQDCPDTCWQVLPASNCDGAVCTPIVITSFPDCQSCLPPPPPVPPLELHPRRIKPGYYTPGCSPGYTENVNCNFGDQMYNEMLIARYGLLICCDEERVKWSIKKELLELRAIFDPSLCKCFLNSCCPPTCVDAIIQAFNPMICPPPSGVVALLSLVPGPCVPPEINFTWIKIT